MAAGAAKKVYDLNLPQLGPYNLSFTRNGRHVVLGGRLGHLAVMETQGQAAAVDMGAKVTYGELLL